MRGWNFCPERAALQYRAKILKRADAERALHTLEGAAAGIRQALDAQRAKAGQGPRAKGECTRNPSDECVVICVRQHDEPDRPSPTAKGGGQRRRQGTRHLRTDRRTLRALKSRLGSTIRLAARGSRAFAPPQFSRRHTSNNSRRRAWMARRRRERLAAKRPFVISYLYR